MENCCSIWCFGVLEMVQLDLFYSYKIIWMRSFGFEGFCEGYHVSRMSFFSFYFFVAVLFLLLLEVRYQLYTDICSFPESFMKAGL